MTILHENIGPICFSSQTILQLYAICTTHYELQFPSGNKFLCCTPAACLSCLRINGSIFFLNCKKKSLEFGMSLCLCFCSLLKKYTKSVRKTQLRAGEMHNLVSVFEDIVFDMRIFQGSTDVSDHFSWTVLSKIGFSLF